MSPALRIVLGCTLAAIAYGVLHDQVTVRACEAYFTRGHPPLVETRSPTLLALAWGVAATWWVGLGIGALVAAAARLGSAAPIEPRALLRPGAVLVAVAALGALGSGLATAQLAPAGATLPFPTAPQETARCLGVAAAHATSYGVGGGGALVLAGWIWGGRRRRSAA